MGKKKTQKDNEMFVVNNEPVWVTATGEFKIVITDKPEHGVKGVTFTNQNETDEK